MRPLYTGLLLALLSISVFAQKPPIKFGKVAKDEIAMTHYDKDPTAPALVLADYGQSLIMYRQNVGFTVDYDRITRIKILTKDGLGWGNFEIRLNKRGADREKLVTLKAVTYNLESGKIVESKLKNDGIFESEYDEYHDIVKVTCPNVREGSVVEITYRINSPYPSWMRDWTFQTTIPTLFSEYRTSVPEYYHFDRYAQGYITLDANEHSQVANTIRLTSMDRTGGRVVQNQFSSNQIDYQEHRYRWAVSDVPAFKPEPYMTSMHDYLSRINFELVSMKWPNRPIERIMGTWEDLNKTLAEYEAFLPVVTGNGFLKKIVEEVTLGLDDPSQKVAAIVQYVKQNVLWDGRQRMFASRPLRKVLGEKKGHSGEVNLLLGSMLEKAGVDVKPVIISTRENGLLRVATPVLSQFNYVIIMAELEGKSILLDATESLLPVGLLPERCLNGQGLAISKAGPQWIPLDSHFKTRVLAAADMSLSPDGYLEGTIKVDCNGYEALRRRKKYLSDGEENFVRDFIGSRQWDVKSTTVENARAIGESFRNEHKLVVNENLMQAGEVIYLAPLLTNSLAENPFKSETREYPVDFGSPFDHTFSLHLTIPDGYVIEEVPEAKVITLPENSARYIYNVAQAEGTITITSMMQINRSLFSQIEYPYLREFFSLIVAKQAEQVVLKKRD